MQLSVPDVVKCLCVLGLARSLGPASRFPRESAAGPVSLGPLVEGSGGVKTLCECGWAGDREAGEEWWGRERSSWV